MKKEWKARTMLWILVCLVAVVSCKKSEPKMPKSPPSPSAATLSFPNNGETCLEGVPIDDQRSRILFQWNDSQNTDSYTVTVTNLNTNSTTNTNSSSSQADIVVNRGTPYAWFVTSKANGTNATATSVTWRFYNEGPGIQNYAPFPAEVVSPAQGASVSGTTVDLSWRGQDVDANDTLSYEVFMDESDDPSTKVGMTSNESLAEIAISTNTVYNWKVITWDDSGNSSTSEIFQFRVQ